MNKIYFGYAEQFGYGFIMTFIFISFIINMIFNVYIFITQILKNSNIFLKFPLSLLRGFG